MALLLSSLTRHVRVWTPDTSWWTGDCSISGHISAVRTVGDGLIANVVIS